MTMPPSTTSTSPAPATSMAWITPRKSSRHRTVTAGPHSTGRAERHRSAGDITLFDSTGLAIQDLAVAKAAYAKAADLPLATIEL